MAEAELSGGGEFGWREPLEGEGFALGLGVACDGEGEGQADGVLARVDDADGAGGGEILGDVEGLIDRMQVEGDGGAEGFVELALDGLGEGLVTVEAAADGAPADALVGRGAGDQADAVDGTFGARFEAQDQNVHAADGDGLLDLAPLAGGEPLGLGHRNHVGRPCFLR